MDAVNRPEDLPGIDPKNVAVATADLSAEEREAINSLVADEEDIELLDSEIMGCVRILQHLTDKYSQRPAHYSTLVSMKNEAEYLFEKINLRVLVDWTPIMVQQPPMISIVGRVNEFDPHQKAWEVKQGVADAYYERQ